MLLLFCCLCLAFSFSVVILGNSSLTIFRFSYCETLLFHSIRPLQRFLMPVFLGSRGNSSTYNEMIKAKITWDQSPT